MYFDPFKISWKIENFWKQSLSQTEAFVAVNIIPDLSNISENDLMKPVNNYNAFFSR